VFLGLFSRCFTNWQDHPILRSGTRILADFYRICLPYCTASLFIYFSTEWNGDFGPEISPKKNCAQMLQRVFQYFPNVTARIRKPKKGEIGRLEHGDTTFSVCFRGQNVPNNTFISKASHRKYFGDFVFSFRK